MTREELIRNLKYTMEKHKNDTVNTFGTNISVMCKDILDYLEQEPCCDECKYKTFTELYFHTDPEIVEQEPKTGHWIINKDKSLARCSNCKFNLKDKDEIKLLGTFMQGYNYCPYCNTKMVEPQESEVNNG